MTETYTEILCRAARAEEGRVMGPWLYFKLGWDVATYVLEFLK